MVAYSVEEIFTERLIKGFTQSAYKYIMDNDVKKPNLDEDGNPDYAEYGDLARYIWEYSLINPCYLELYSDDDLELIKNIEIKHLEDEYCNQTNERFQTELNYIMRDNSKHDRIEQLHFILGTKIEDNILFDIIDECGGNLGWDV